MSTTEIARSTGAASVVERRRGSFDPGQVELIRTTVAKDCNVQELGMFLEVCARWELDPFMKQVWAIKIRGKVQIVVSRDGLLAIANRYPDFRGCRSDVVREHDAFELADPEKCVMGAWNTWLPRHAYRDAEGNPTADNEKRGRILGGWALVFREGHVPTWFFASWDEYHKEGAGGEVWKSHPTAMMQKVPEGYALRKAYSVSGIIAEGEEHRIDGVQASSSAITARGQEPDYGDEPFVAAKLRQAFDLLGYTERKRLTRLLSPAGTPLTHEGREAVLEQLHAELADKGVEVPPLESELAIEGSAVEVS